MRIVLDTNVVLSALLWRGLPYRLLQAVQQHRNIQLYSSTVLVEELTRVSAPGRRFVVSRRTRS